MNFTLSLPPIGEQWKAELDVEVSGDRAIWTHTWEPHPVEQVLVFDEPRKAWMLEMIPAPTNEAEAEGVCNFFRSLEHRVDVGMKALEESGITLRELKTRMAKATYRRSRRRDNSVIPWGQALRCPCCSDCGSHRGQA